MSLLKRLFGSGKPDARADLERIELKLPGWTDEGVQKDLRFWRDADGITLSLALVGPATVPAPSDQPALQSWAREHAEKRGAGLIDARALAGSEMAVGYIYKRLQVPAYIFTGMGFVPTRTGWQVWTVVAGETGTTGVREATITADLMNSGALTLEGYESDWARDPYDAGYAGVDRRVLRFISDDESYDERFPSHPLSRVRRVLDVLPEAVSMGKLD